MASNRELMQRIAKLEQRIEALETGAKLHGKEHAWRENVGMFANDPLMQECLREDRERWENERQRDMAKLDRQRTRGKTPRKKSTRRMAQAGD